MTIATIYLDTSAINQLANDPAAAAIIAGITRRGHEVHTSSLAVVELASTPDPEKRAHLLSIARRITQSFHPLDLPGAILKKSLQAHLAGKNEAVMSVDPRVSGLWEALRRPEDVDETLRLKAELAKQEQENWFTASHQRARQALESLNRPRLPKPLHYIRPACGDETFLKSNFAEIIRAGGGDPEKTSARELLDTLGPWRGYFTALALEHYNRAARAERYGPSKNPGGIDVQQAVYLSGHDFFITHDKLQRRFMRNVCRIADIRVTVVDYSSITELMA